MNNVNKNLLKVGSLTLLAFLAACSGGQQTTQNEIKETNVMAQNSFTQSLYGALADGTEIYEVALRNANGVEMNVINYGGIVTHWATPDANGELGNIVLSLDNLDEYVSGSPYFGALIGRYGNRIAEGKFSIDGVDYQLDVNDGDNSLHGGSKGFDKRVWGMKPFQNDDGVGVVLSLVSEDGDMGYPGTLTTEAIYELKNDNSVEVRFTASTDKPTVVNLTQHNYFNLSGGGSILDHELMMPADKTTPVRAGLIPTGELADVEGTPFDFREAKAIGRDIDIENEQLAFGGGYDHNWVLNKEYGQMTLGARLSDPKSGRVLEVYSVEPAMQFYSGNFLDGSLDGNGVTHNFRSGLCLEPQHNPDSPNHEHFPSTVLRPGEIYTTTIIYKTSVAKQLMSLIPSLSGYFFDQ